MSHAAQACKASDSDRPPSYRVVEDSELLRKGRETRASKPKEHYSLLPVKRVQKSSGDTTENFHHLTPILPVAPSAPEPTDSSFDSDEFSVRFNVCSLHDTSVNDDPSTNVVSNDDVFDDASTTAEVHDLGARSKVSTPWLKVIYTSVEPLSLPPPLATAARLTKSLSIKRLIHRYALCVAARGTCDWTDNP